MFDSTHLSHGLTSLTQYKIANGSFPPNQKVLLPMIVHEARAEVNHCDGKTGKSPLILASGVGADNVCQLLLDSKALIDGEKLGDIGRLMRF